MNMRINYYSKMYARNQLFNIFFLNFLCEREYYKIGLNYNMIFEFFWVNLQLIILMSLTDLNTFLIYKFLIIVKVDFV